VLQKLLVFLINSKTLDLLPKPTIVSKFRTLRCTGRSLGYSKQSATNYHMVVSVFILTHFLG